MFRKNVGQSFAYHVTRCLFPILFMLLTGSFPPERTSRHILQWPLTFWLLSVTVTRKQILSLALISRVYRCALKNLPLRKGKLIIAIINLQNVIWKLFHTQKIISILILLHISYNPAKIYCDPRCSILQELVWCIFSSLYLILIRTIL
jgi:hypothetical protein